MRRVLAIVLGLALLAAAPLTAVAQSKGEIVIGMQCDRTGATQLVGVVYCPGIHDYIHLVNSKGGIEGYAVKALEIDHEYKVPPGMEAYERHKKEGAVSMMIYGTPHAQALNSKLTEDPLSHQGPSGV